MSRGLAVLAIPVIVVGYGFYDAYATRRIEPSTVQMTLRAIPWDSLFFDSMEPYSDTMSDGDVFAEVRWLEKSDLKVRKVVIGGEAFLDGRSLGRFGGTCQRGGKTWLGDNTVPINGLSDKVNNDPVCFIRLPQNIDHLRGPNGRAVDQQERERVRGVIRRVELRNTTADVQATNKPMRYVSWIQDKAVGLRDNVVWAFSYPFSRV